MTRLLPLVVLLAGCGEQWTVLGEELDAALLHVRQDDDGSVWAIGHDPGDGPYVYVYDAGAWDKLSTGDSGTLWWGWGEPDAVWMTGVGGRILRYDRATETFDVTVIDPVYTFFGVWGIAGGPIWVVGEDITGVDGAQMWKYNGTIWTEETLPAVAQSTDALYKIWGTDEQNVWAVGTSGIILHYDGLTWSTVESPTGEPLITVHGDGDDVVAVGGEVNGVLLEYDGSAWSSATVDMAPRLSGTYVPSGCDAIAVGALGAIYRRTEGEWVAEKKVVTEQDYHSGLVDTDCGAWAVGGRLSSPDLNHGVIVYQGSEHVPELP